MAVDGVHDALVDLEAAMRAALCAPADAPTSAGDVSDALVDAARALESAIDALGARVAAAHECGWDAAALSGQVGALLAQCPRALEDARAEEQRAQEALRAAEVRLRTLVEGHVAACGLPILGVADDS